MNIEIFYSYCLTQKGVTEHFPFDKDTLVFKVGGKMFALLSLKEWENGNQNVTLKCNPSKACELRTQYDSITPGYHMNKIHWNTVKANSEITDNFLLELTEHSYNLVFNSLPKKTQKLISNNFTSF